MKRKSKIPVGKSFLGTAFFTVVALTLCPLTPLFGGDVGNPDPFATAIWSIESQDSMPPLGECNNWNGMVLDDLNQDGELEVITISNGALQVWKDIDANGIPEVLWSYDLGDEGETFYQPAVADLDGNGESAIIVRNNVTFGFDVIQPFVPQEDAIQWAFHPPVPVQGLSERRFAIGNVENNAPDPSSPDPLEVVMVANNFLYVVENGGNLLWQQEFEASLFSPVLSDMDGDGLMEVIVAILGEPALIGVYEQDSLNPGQGKEIMLWVLPEEQGPFILFEPAVANIDNAGLPELIFAYTTFFGPLEEIIQALFVDPNDHQLRELWSYSIPTLPGLVQNRTNLVVGDLESDGQVEIMLPSTDFLNFLNGADGTEKRPPLPMGEVEGYTTIPQNKDLILIDLTGDGKLDVLFDGFVIDPFAADIQNPVYQFGNPSHSTYATVAGDLVSEPDNKMELVVWFWDPPPLSTGTCLMTAFRAEHSDSLPNPLHWTTKRGNNRRTASVHPDGILPTCIGDINNDGTVNPLDLALLLAAWGTNPEHPADLNVDGTVDTADLATLLGNWGSCT